MTGWGEARVWRSGGQERRGMRFRASACERSGVWAPDQVWGDGKEARGVGEAKCNDGTVHVEIPPFEPGAGSAASAGMTGWGEARVWRSGGQERRGMRFRASACERSGVWAPDQVWGDGKEARGVGGGMQRWCWSRRDTPVRAGGRLRGKRGYDGVGRVPERRRRCEASVCKEGWVWAPDQVWGDGGGGSVATDGGGNGGSVISL